MIVHALLKKKKYYCEEIIYYMYIQKNGQHSLSSCQQIREMSDCITSQHNY